MRCEDFPCCGHGDEGCPDPERIADGYLPYPCICCGKLIKADEAVRGHESYCRPCFTNPDTFSDDYQEGYDDWA